MMDAENRKREFVNAALLGAIAGMRSMLAPAVVLRSHPRGAGASTLKTFMDAATALELIGDKTSFVPARTNLIPFAGRLASGGLAAFFGARGPNKERAVAAALGVTAAALSTHALFRARRFASVKLGLPNSAAGILEDAAALWAAKLAHTRLSRSPVF